MRPSLKDFIEELLHHCGRWPEPKSIFIMDKAAFYHSKRLEQMCAEAGVKLVFAPVFA
jgi:transposase